MPQLATIKPLASEGQQSTHNYQHLRATPVNGALGAEISNINLSQVSDNSVYEEIHQALLHHQVIVFRDQDLTPGQLINLGRQFGELHINPFVKGLENYPEIMPVRSEENAEKQYTGLWHTDISWDRKPSMGSLLYAIDLPDNGGDTLFSNMYLAFSSLSEGMQSSLRQLRAEHRVDRFHRSKAEYADAPKDGVMHPVVRTHPHTGQEILYVNEYFTTRF